ncbi:MAG TPA: hypothetical protein PLP03_09490 [Bacteroidales bacterium]|nr:hypothetical protein [Bacteroidales bacterium]
MKKLLFNTALLIVINLIFSQALLAQENKSPEDILVGKWILTAKGLAVYDILFSLDAKKTDGILHAAIGMPGTDEIPNEFHNVVLTDSSFYVELEFNSFYVPMPMTIKVADENSLSGAFFGYPMIGKREDQK